MHYELALICIQNRLHNCQKTGPEYTSPGILQTQARKLPVITKSALPSFFSRLFMHGQDK